MLIMPSSMCSNEVSCHPAMVSNLPCSIGRIDLCSCRGLRVGPLADSRNADEGPVRASRPGSIGKGLVMETSRDARPTAGHTQARGGRLRSITMILVFDVAAPLAAYNLLRSAGVTAVAALLL